MGLSRRRPESTAALVHNFVLTLMEFSGVNSKRFIGLDMRPRLITCATENCRHKTFWKAGLQNAFASYVRQRITVEGGTVNRMLEYFIDDIENSADSTAPHEYLTAFLSRLICTKCGVKGVTYDCEQKEKPLPPKAEVGYAWQFDEQELTGPELAVFRNKVVAMSIGEIEGIDETALTREQKNIVGRARSAFPRSNLGPLDFDSGNPYATTDGQ